MATLYALPAASALVAAILVEREVVTVRKTTVLALIGVLALSVAVSTHAAARPGDQGMVSRQGGAFQATPLAETPTPSLAPSPAATATFTVTPAVTPTVTPTSPPLGLRGEGSRLLVLILVGITCVAVPLLLLGGAVLVILGVRLWRKQAAAKEAPRPSPVGESVGGVSAEQTLCPHCGHANRPQAQHCAACGKPLRPLAQPAEKPTFCWNCGRRVRPTSRFCPHCGEAL